MLLKAVLPKFCSLELNSEKYFTIKEFCGPKLCEILHSFPSFRFTKHKCHTGNNGKGPIVKKPATLKEPF